MAVCKICMNYPYECICRKPSIVMKYYMKFLEILENIYNKLKLLCSKIVDIVKKYTSQR